MRSMILVIALCAATAGGSARSAESSDEIRPTSEPATQADSLQKGPAKAATETRRRRAPRSLARCRGSKAYSAAGPAAAVVAPVEHPLMPPLGARVWRHEDPPLFDPYGSAGPWYTGPWVHPGTNVAQWRYGFPGGHVDWFRRLGWRPGFGWY